VNYGIVLAETGRAAEAAAQWEEALKLCPNDVDILANLGNVYRMLKRYADAEERCRRALAIDAHHVGALTNIGLVHWEQARIDDAMDAYQAALKTTPDDPELWNNIGIVLHAQGKRDEGIAAYRRAIELRPNYAAPWSNLLVSVHYHPYYDGKMILAEHRRWAELMADPLTGKAPPHANDRDPNRRLKIAYSSPELLGHPVGLFMHPILQHHDHANYEIIIYSDVVQPDDYTHRLRALADQWHDVGGLSDAQLAKKVRDDRIDVLVDLTLHGNRNRMMTFARKPAPVQATYLAFAGTSGLKAMDWRITDVNIDPPGVDDCYSEKSYRLPETYWCYSAPPEARDVVPPPMLTNGFVTFGCLNYFTKVSSAALKTWAQILQRVPDSRLLVQSDRGGHWGLVREYFVDRGIDQSRIELVPRQKYRRYLQTYNRIDIVLDPYPYNGGTTTCDSMWMGAAVVTLAGERGVARAGVTLLTNVGLTDHIAHAPQQYIDLAVALGSDPQRLAKLRGEMRQRMLRSPLMDAPRFTRNLEAAYRHMWKAWCAT
jgi:predicted O-linked N-acetylglucosamine transferase (SPINDLY family)